MPPPDLERLASRILQRVERLLPEPDPGARLDEGNAWRWTHSHPVGPVLRPLRRRHAIQFTDLVGIDRQRDALAANVAQFLRGEPYNHVLMWGPRGAGKSSLLHATLQHYLPHGLQAVEVDQVLLPRLAELLDLLARRTDRRYLLLADDISFGDHEPAFQAFKGVLEGSLEAFPENVLLAVTSNRRHLVAEYQAENRAAGLVGGELHYGDATEEKTALADRFGLWLSFHPLDQEAYLAVVRHWLSRYSCGEVNPDEIEVAACRWARARGTRSARIANQFARDWAGRQHSPGPAS